jgi:hypothetical protein
VKNAGFRLIVTAVFMICAASRIAAECVTLGGPKAANRLVNAHLVFVGDVLGVEDGSTPQHIQTRVQFRVIEAFKGVRRGERSMQFRASAEGFSFRPLQRVLVYARKDDDVYTTHCTTTRVVSLDDREVGELRRLTSR